MRAIVKAAVQRELGIALIPVDEKAGVSHDRPRDGFHAAERVQRRT